MSYAKAAKSFSAARKMTESVIFDSEAKREDDVEGADSACIGVLVLEWEAGEEAEEAQGAVLVSSSSSIRVPFRIQFKDELFHSILSDRIHNPIKERQQRERNVTHSTMQRKNRK